ncbi:single-stranded DNA-binding protein [Parasphaerochaeta coccoides]|uniref:Single-stranded DNA-binding protein n=1 Tax=Parasphaerochaeta coccoides (strain ATCC BAA-1237 / DSM 17374 / SPN1) TaxID=760011 RepID=F4GLF7_PARC1|nr:single-stranded DNA-binding protein [Parasphaerochaeta coccoides]AEC01927.1 single-strand binding protein [Parasphaerochaeta coccoides DSM 17374]
MANDLNVVALVGRLTRESELRYANSGSAVCRFSIAVNRRKKTGETWEDEASYFDCVLFGKSAENLHQYLDKGRQVSIVGELRQNRWEQEGQSRSKVEVFVTNLQLLGSSSGNADSRSSDRGRQQGGFNPSEQGQPSRRPAQSQAPADDFLGPEQFDDDIPF